MTKTAAPALPGSTPKRKRRPGFVWELIGCAQGGHALVGTRAAALSPEDPHLAREMDGIRWHRCLRCDAWLPIATPVKPDRPGMPSRDEIELPLRGRPLRDRYVLRVIAVDRALHFLGLAIIVVAILLLAINRARYQTDVTKLINAFQGTSSSTKPHGILGELYKLTNISTAHLYEAAAAAAVYALLEGAEAVGLWWGKRWAEYLTFLATILLLPVEIYELTEKISWFKIATLVINLAIAVYLLLAKRLFGLRGGGAHELEVRAYDSGWAAVERLSPEMFTAAGAPYRPEFTEVREHDTPTG
ncbi:DUF2127 domain-containing protein [Acidothermaceae bacterium B102]|nr:DUF2127 domain-containing protein [Acidothermaceae bacterium B102]